jgi:NADH:ubiquinone oxidoreductase subunit C
MNNNLKLYLGLILEKQNYVFINNFLQTQKVDNLFLSPMSFYFLTIHLRFATLFYSTQLVDIFSYEIPTPSIIGSGISGSNTSPSSVVVYNFHMLSTHNKLIIFIKNFDSATYGSGHTNFYPRLFSISELFSAANWLEREAAELHGTNFYGKKDLRNLMLQYGDTSVPFQKSSPSIGYKEFYYDSVNDVLIETPITLQV